MSDHTTRTQASADALAAADALARERALDITASWLVQAPAGSGKTELLVQRMLALLAHVERPERVVATTFTRKAAAEMRARIVAALADAAAGIAVDTPHRARTRELAERVLAQDRALGWRLLEFPGRLDVGTLDALAQRIAAQHPIASALGGAPRPCEAAAARALYRLAAQRAIAAAPAHDRAWRTLIEHFDNDADRVAELLVTMLARRDQWLPPLYALRDPATRAALEQTLVEEIEAQLADVARRWPGASVQGLVALAHEVRKAVADAATQDAAKAPLGTLLDTLCRDGALPPASCAALAHWRTLVGWVLTDAGTFRKSTLGGFAAIGKGEGVTERRVAQARVVAWLRDATAIDGLETALQRLRHLPPDPRYSPRARAFIDALLELLPQAAAMLDVVFAEEGRSDFAEVTRRALATLGEAEDPSPILLAQDLRIEHLLVDEFQDTSRPQLAFIERLISGWQPGDGRTLFAVGDPMQSIYGFRDADVRNFLVAAREGRIGGVALGTLRLARNFRAVAELVDHVNATFPRVLARVATRSTDAVTFGEALPTQPGGDGAPTLEWAMDADDEAARVVARARDALAAGCEDVAILVRARPQAAAILPALRAAGIGYDAVKLESLAERPQSRDLLWLARALTQPADLLAWLVVLRAPWCGLVLADLLAFADAARMTPPQRLLHDRARDAALTPDGAARLQRVATIVANVEHARAAPLVARVRAAWFALGGPVAYGEDASNLVAADAMFTLLAVHDRGGDIDDWDALQDEAAALLADPPVAAGALVKVMTLHGAKGLEFDAVVLPGLDRPLKRDGPALLRWRTRTGDNALMVGTPRARDEEDADPIDAWLGKLADEERIAEEARLLYVGFTRARRRLHVVAKGRVKRDDAGETRWAEPGSDSPLALLWPLTAENDARAGPAGGTPAQGSDAAPLQSTAPDARRAPPLVRLPRDGAMPALPEDVAAMAPAERATSRIPYDWAGADAAAIGTVVHRALARFATAGLPAADAVDFASHRRRIEAELAALGVHDEARGASAARALQSIEGALRDPQGRWLFDASHTEAASELALSARGDAGVDDIVIDRTFVADGVRWIVDFKTSRHAGGELDAFLARERDRYAGQLARYANAMALLDERPIRLALYFPVHARLVAWDFPR